MVISVTNTPATRNAQRDGRQCMAQADVEERGYQRARPCPGARQRNGHKQRQPQQTVFPHQAALQVRPPLQGIDLRGKEGVLPQPVEYLPHGENDERYRQKISDDCGDTGRPWGQSGGGPGGDGARSSTTGTAAMAMVIMYFPRTVSQKAMRSPLHKNCPGV